MNGRKLSFFYLRWILLIGAISCKHENDTIDSTAFSKTSYPLNVGNWWQYRVVDFNARTIDTLSIRISSKTVQNGEVIYRCELEEYGTVIDSAQFVLTESSLSYQGLDATYSYFGDFKLKLPFYQGETWKGFSDVDSMNVISFSTDYNVLGKKYDIYYLKRTVPGAAYSVVQSLQLSKNIGLVSQNINIFWGGLTQRQSFQLIDYELK
jgi:hypothetical protein